MSSQEAKYNPESKESILSYAKKLIGKCLSDVTDSPDTKKNLAKKRVKGSFGQYLEKYYFGIDNNSDSAPDFSEAGVELKSHPIIKRSKGFSPKERVVLNIINYMTIIDETWSKSHFLSKNELILFVTYLYEQDKEFLDYIIKYVFLWRLEGKDKEIIKQDWHTIVNKIKAGKAHELSEGDTFYLGACRKGHKEAPRQQPNSDVGAPQRAFSFKTTYIRHVLEQVKETEQALSLSDVKKGFEKSILEKINKYQGLEVQQIIKKVKSDVNQESKQVYAQLARAMLGVHTKKVEEFEKANISMKIIRLQESGMPKESMSFPYFKFKEVASQEWEESDFFEQVEKKFFFVVYRMKGDKVFFEKAFFWNMPYDDRLEAKRVWETTKKVIKRGVKTKDLGYKVTNNFPNITDSSVAHVRPHGRNKDDTDVLPSGKQFTKQCFWLNQKYLKKIVEEN